MNKVLSIAFRLAFVFFVSACENNVDITYHENGQVASRVQISNGVRNGEALKYYKNGAIKWKASYSNGLLNGEAVEYDSTGKVLTTFEYMNNIMQGPFLTYYPNGKIKEKGVLSQGKRDGMCFEFYQSGSIFRRSYCVQDTVVYGKTFSEDGKLIASNLPIKVTPIDGLNSVEIELTYSEFEKSSIAILIGVLDSSGFMLDTLDYVESDNMKYLYKLDSNQTSISGVLFEIKEPELTFEAQYHFDYTLPPTGRSIL